jgi:hypothetical protein
MLAVISKGPEQRSCLRPATVRVIEDMLLPTLPTMTWKIAHRDLPHRGKRGLAQMRQGMATIMATGTELSPPLCLFLLA